MIGLGVGIDYALFIVTRYRQGLAEGRDPRQCGGGVAGHLRAGRRVRRDHGDPVAARALPAPAPVHAGPGHRGHRRRGAGHAGRHHPAAGHARVRRTGHRQAGHQAPAAERRRARPAGFLVPVEPEHPASTRPVHGGGRRSCWSAWPSRCSRCAWPSPTPATTRRRPPPVRRSTPWPTGFGPGFNGPLIVVAQVPAGQKARGRGPRRRRAHDPRGRLRQPGRVQRVGRRRPDRRLPDHRPPGGPDRGARPHPARRGDPRGDGRHRGAGLRRRGDGRIGGRLHLPVRPAAVGDRRRAPAVVPAADGRVPLGGHPAEGGDRQPAVGGAPPTA